MKKDIARIVSALKNSRTLNKNTFHIKKTSTASQLLKFLKTKNIINNFYDAGGNIIIYTNVSGHMPLVKDIKLSLLNHNINFQTFKGTCNKTQNPYILEIFSTSYGLMDQHDLYRFKVGGILLCKIFFI